MEEEKRKNRNSEKKEPTLKMYRSVYAAPAGST